MGALLFWLAVMAGCYLYGVRTGIRGTKQRAWDAGYDRGQGDAFSLLEPPVMPS